MRAIFVAKAIAAGFSEREIMAAIEEFSHDEFYELARIRRFKVSTVKPKECYL